MKRGDIANRTRERYSPSNQQGKNRNQIKAGGVRRTAKNGVGGRGGDKAWLNLSGWAAAQKGWEISGAKKKRGGGKVNPVP